MSKPTLLPKRTYQICGCKPDRQHCPDHAVWMAFKPKGRKQVRASGDDLAAKPPRTIKEVEIVLAAFMKAANDGTYAPKQKLRADAGAALVADGVDAYAEYHLVDNGTVIVPRGARERREDERYLAWLCAMIAACIANKDADPEVRERAIADRGRLSMLKRIVSWWGDRTLASLGVGDSKALVSGLRKPAKFQERSRETLLRSVATLNRIIATLVHWGDWLTLNGPTLGAEPFLKVSPFRFDGKLAIRQESEDNERDRRCQISEEVQLHMACDPTLAWLSRLIIGAIDSLMRKGELRRLKIADIDERPGWIRVIGSVRKKQRKSAGLALRVGARVNKTGKERWMPVSTDRLAAVFDHHRRDDSGRLKGPKEYVFCDGTGARPIASWSYQWELLKLRATGWVTRAEADELTRQGHAGPLKVITWRKAEGKRGNAGLSLECMDALDEIDLHWHDLRAEGISRLAENPMLTEGQIGEWAGNPSCIARYIRRVRQNKVTAQFAREAMNAAAQTVITSLSRSQEVKKDDAAA